MDKISGGELLARCIASEGIEFVFGLPCPEIDPLLAALDDHQHPLRAGPARSPPARTWRKGVYKTTGKAVSAVLGNPGPGSANSPPRCDHGAPRGRAAAGDHLAAPARHRLPVAALDLPGPGPARCLRPEREVGWADSLEWDRIPERRARLAFREMWSGRPGPVQLEIPAPVLLRHRRRAVPSSRRARAWSAIPVRTRLEASESQLEQAAELLASPPSGPFVLAGAGVDRARGQRSTPAARRAPRLPRRSRPWPAGPSYPGSTSCAFYPYSRGSR